jgi:Sulfotransferase family
MDHVKPPTAPPEIVVILAPPRSFTSVTCAMLGQHPELYGVPELRLFDAGTLGEWTDLCRQASYPMASGTLRAVAQLVFGEQTATTIQMARRWVRLRSHWSTRRLIRFLGELVYPRILVDKSPSTVYSSRALFRAYRMFPQARFIHLLRHPRGHAESVLKLMRFIEARRQAPLPPHNWLVRLSSFALDGQDLQIPDPQRAWYVLNSNIRRFLESIPETQGMAVRGEDLLSNPDIVLEQIARWLGVRTDQDAIEAMKHPERSPYVGFGPKGASRGNDPFFLTNPRLRSNHPDPGGLDGPLSWRPGRTEFLPEVKALARGFGYQ